MSGEKILLSHGSGGRLMQELIRDLLLKKLGNPVLKELSDSAYLECKGRLAFTTDSFVVSPLFFPGADIGKLAVCGTINDLVMSAAKPLYLSLAIIVEEGLELGVLEKIVDSISREAERCNVIVVTGDFKVVERGACDRIFINTSGIGRILADRRLSLRNIKAGDRIILTGGIGEHGIAVLSSRKDLDLGFNIRSDCCALDKLLIPLLKKTKAIKFMRDPTRGGIASTLNEIAQGCGLGIVIEERDVPVSAKVRTACELLGIDPFNVANEGKAMIVVDENSAQEVLSSLKREALGRKASIVGRVVKEPKKKVILDTPFNGKRILDMPEAEALPRIC
ncbi:MAG TPA: hydrogenase expression/formation protein HypE [Candidatus Margulisiibacteriota bacterium]|nr:hydrogenase expression/formation protein HypE [Candidatus Margulisiibacteriota bacterium]